ncbi:MAG: D-TA family PLP-dependent enzyme, partial [Bacteroidetes bacterium]
DVEVVQALTRAGFSPDRPLPVYLDLDVGMGRTGIAPGPEAVAVYRAIAAAPGLQAAGLHVYDGHLRQPDPAARLAAADALFAEVVAFRDALQAEGLPVPDLVVGGSPSFPLHRQRPGIRLSPGTFPFWDAGYGALCPELPFQPAAVLVSRVISRPGRGRLCLDLGHKAVAAENPLDQRVRFLNLAVTAWVGQSEEHLVVEVADPDAWPVGSLVYGVPWHICPTTALYQAVVPVMEGACRPAWPVVARDRKLTF